MTDPAMQKDLQEFNFLSHVAKALKDYPHLAEDTVFVDFKSTDDAEYLNNQFLSDDEFATIHLHISHYFNEVASKIGVLGSHQRRPMENGKSISIVTLFPHPKSLFKRPYSFLHELGHVLDPLPPPRGETNEARNTLARELYADAFATIHCVLSGDVTQESLSLSGFGRVYTMLLRLKNGEGHAAMSHGTFQVVDAVLADAGKIKNSNLSPQQIRELAAVYARKCLPSLDDMDELAHVLPPCVALMKNDGAFDPKNWPHIEKSLSNAILSARPYSIAFYAGARFITEVHKSPPPDVQDDEKLPPLRQMIAARAKAYWPAVAHLLTPLPVKPKGCHSSARIYYMLGKQKPTGL